MCIVPTPSASTTVASQTQPAPASAAEQLSPQQRQRIALDVLQGHSISELARQHNVSRKFVRAQRSLALDAIDSAFVSELPPEEQVLYHLPVTRAWLEQLSLALVLICHSSVRGVHEILRDLFDCHRSVGSIHYTLEKAIAKAAGVNAHQDLKRIMEVALDELFQNGDPILSVVDVASTYCCLLSLEEHRDADTWGIRLLELQEQGLSPCSTIGDGGKGLRAGVALAFPGLRCRADLFHVERDMGQMVRFLENRAYTAISTYDKLHRQLQHGSTDPGVQLKHDAAQREMVRAITLADDVAVLAHWLGQDVLGVAGPKLQQRQDLYDFVLAELKVLQPLCEHRLKPVCSVLHKHKADLLAFVEDLDRDIGDLAAWMRVPQEVVREMMAVQEMPATSAARWQRDAVLHQQLGERYDELSRIVEELRGSVVRASSVVENVNSRLRSYFFLRKEVGQGSLELMRFFLNHRRFLRSKHDERVGKSPAELLSGQEHSHWLEMLGYTLFRRAA